MGDLNDFAKRLDQQLASANRKPHWAPGEAERYMAGVAERRQRFEEIALQLVQSVVQPRLQMLASRFPNAKLARNEPPGRLSYWFGYCERFPASTYVALAVEHDVRYCNLTVCYEARMMPSFIKFHEHDKHSLPLEQVSEPAVGNWVEERLMEFLEAYLRIDRGGEDFDEDAATDPVCGMRITRSAAAATAEYCGHPYYFCSSQCHTRFANEPTQYVQVTGV